MLTDMIKIEFAKFMFKYNNLSYLFIYSILRFFFLHSVEMPQLSPWCKHVLTFGASKTILLLCFFFFCVHSVLIAIAVKAVNFD